MPRASVHTLGCRLNQAESALLSDAFRSDGFEMVPESEPADLFVINSCSVTRGAEAKCRRRVRYLLKRSPEARGVVTGCYAEHREEGSEDALDVCLGVLLDGERHVAQHAVEGSVSHGLRPWDGEGFLLLGRMREVVFDGHIDGP